MRVLARTGRKAGVLSWEGVSRFHWLSVILPTASRSRVITLEWMDWGEHACALKSPPWMMAGRIPHSSRRRSPSPLVLFRYSASITACPIRTPWLFDDLPGLDTHAL